MFETSEAKPVTDLNVKLFADGADRTEILLSYGEPYIEGFTTNPTLMRKAGITDYESFARDILQHIVDLPISFEVFANDFEKVYHQAPADRAGYPVTMKCASTYRLICRSSHTNACSFDHDYLQVVCKGFASFYRGTTSANNEDGGVLCNLM